MRPWVSASRSPAGAGSRLQASGAAGSPGAQPAQCMSTHAHLGATTLTHEASYLLHQPFPTLTLPEAPGESDIHLIPSLKAWPNESYNKPLHTPSKEGDKDRTAHTRPWRSRASAGSARKTLRACTGSEAHPGGQQQTKLLSSNPTKGVGFPNLSAE